MVMVGRNAPPPIFRAKIGIRGVWSSPAAEGVFACDLQPSFLLLAVAAVVAVAVPFFQKCESTAQSISKDCLLK